MGTSPLNGIEFAITWAHAPISGAKRQNDFFPNRPSPWKICSSGHSAIPSLTPIPAALSATFSIKDQSGGVRVRRSMNHSYLHSDVSILSQAHRGLRRRPDCDRRKSTWERGGGMGILCSNISSAKLPEIAKHCNELRAQH